jgi:hypothetical protein
MVVHAYNPSTWEAESSLGYIVRLCLKTWNKMKQILSENSSKGSNIFTHACYQSTGKIMSKNFQLGICL